MAKAKDSTVKDSTAAVPDIHAVAERLFAAAWKPRGNVDAWMIAVEAYRGAAEFVKVAEQIATGYTTEDVLADKILQEETAANTSGE